MNTRIFRFGLLLVLLVLGGAAKITQAADNPFLGDWELTLPGHAAGWLGVEEKGGRLTANIMWSVGSVVPVATAKVENNRLVLTRDHEIETKDAAGKKSKKKITETLNVTREGPGIRVVSIKPRESGQGEERAEVTGKLSPPMPPAPDLSKVKFGPAKSLFNGKDLSGWRLTDPNASQGWSVKDGLLVNTVVQEDGKPHKNFGNLRTDEEFEDFNLKLEVRVGEGQNSGIYLRGMYEVQVADSYGQPPSEHNMGSIYSRIKTSKNASKPAGQWQAFDITLVDRHVTVVLNGTEVISNQPVRGCTGGALSADVSRPGPIYFQGDHTSVAYRNIVIRPVLGKSSRAAR